MSRSKNGLIVARPSSPNAKLVREIALENQELLKMLATNGKYKPKTEKPSGTTQTNCEGHES